jgi:hypothetical protein
MEHALLAHPIAVSMFDASPGVPLVNIQGKVFHLECPPFSRILHRGYRENTTFIIIRMTSW